MAKISELPIPAALTGLERFPALQSAGNIGLPLFATSRQWGGTVLALRAPMLADLSSTSDADPGAGKLRWNHATPGSASTLYVDDADQDAGDLTPVWPNLPAGSLVYIQGAGPLKAGDWQKWQVTSVTDASGYAKVSVTLLASAGTFANGDELEVSFQQPAPAPGVDRSAVSTLSIVSGVVTIDYSLGDYFTLALTANVTSIVITNLPSLGYAAALHLELQQDATGGRTVALPSSFKAITGSDSAVQSAANARTLLVATSTDAGTRWSFSMKGVAA
jgi:hypothetical protein